jgi:hypothetical protein
MSIRSQILDLAHCPSRPPNSYRNISAELAQSKKQTLTRLRKIAIAGPYCLDDRLIPSRNHYLDSSANRVAIPHFPLQAKTKKPSSTRRIISKKAQLGSGPIRDPEIKISVMIPINQAQRPPILWIVHTGNCGHIGEPMYPSLVVSPKVKIHAMTLATAPRTAPLHHP